MNALEPTDTPPPARTAPLALWRVAEAFMHLLFTLFGAPEDVAATHTLTPKPHQLLASWLRCGEALMRRLLLVEASAFPKPNTRPLLHRQCKRVRRLVGFDAEHPEKWRASFRCFRLDRRRPRRHSPMPDANMPARRRRSRTSFHSAWPLAERYEALLRVFNDPAPYAHRLARRLHALPHRLGEMLRTPPDAAHRIENFEALTEAARARWRAPNTS